MERVKTALLFNDKYKQGYSYIMATTPIPYSNLTADQKIQYAKNVAMSNYGVTQPNTTQINDEKLNNLVNILKSDLQQFKQSSSGISPTENIPLSSFPASLQQYVSPPNVVPPTTLTINDIIGLETGVLSSLSELQTNPATLPAAGASVSPQNVPPAAPTPPLATNTTPATITAPAAPTPPIATNTTPATITAPAAPAPALARNATSATITAPAAPAPAVLRNTTPATITASALPAPNLPRNTTPVPTTAPSTNPSSSIISNILTAATVIGGGAIVLNALNNRVQNSTPTSVTNIDEFTGIDEQIQRQQQIADLGEFAGVDERIEDQIEIDNGLFEFADIDERIEDQIEIDNGLFEFADIDERIEDQIEIDDGSLEFSELDERVEDQIEIDDETLAFSELDERVEDQIEIDDGSLEFVEPEERIEDQIEIDDGSLGLDAAQDETIEEQKIPDEFDGIDEQIANNENALNEPLQEPPATEVDEFTGIDEQVERQRQLEDGSLEFAGIDEQIADNENALQEPPQLSEEEVDAYLQTAGQQDETITSPNSITENVFDPSGNNGASVEENVFDPTGNNGAPTSRGLSTTLRDTQGQATSQDVANFQAKPDWRVRLSLAPGATYLYKDKAAAGILAPLAATDGVIFPYTPAISVQYAASYDPTELTHSNYKFFTYRGSSVDSVSITCDFTAQDTFEANYLLAVIHFFRSVTKMFYGQDQNPKIGTPPPLCYLSGLGAFQFDAHPLAITSFNYTLPTDVDYIRAGATPTQAGVTRPGPKDNSFSSSTVRMGDLQPGGGTAPAQFNTPPGSRDVTYVPTKMSISISAVPIVTRNDISNKFSLKEYGTGKLLRGTQRQGGGIW